MPEDEGIRTEAAADGQEEERERGERGRRIRGRKGDGVDRRASSVESHPLRQDF
jgi:hypothetical protein